MYRIPVFLLFIMLASCNGITVPVLPSIGDISPSPSPVIRSPTLPFVPSATFTPLGTPSPTETDIPSPTLTPSPTSPVDEFLGLLVEISGCNTSLDVTHGMGEVTNAYPLLKNTSAVSLNSICATLTASDEDRSHPDKTVCVDLLPFGQQVTLKLTVDTGFQVDTSIQVDVTTQEGVTGHALAPSCLDIGFPGWIPAEIGVIKPIP